ncbi:MAG: VOC family protein [Candidatus Thermoplasmatota archaeon]|nr:VOC family protein [Candidatus Thermoplasmatota archaeon]
MSGLVFLSTRRLREIVDFYTARLGMEVWLEQEDCTILHHGNLMLGFCQRERADACGIITFYFSSTEEVDGRYEDLKDLAEGPPKENPKYRIYHFFLRDPEGRRLEIQKFHDI